MDGGVNPFHRQVLATYLEDIDAEIVTEAIAEFEKAAAIRDRIKEIKAATLKPKEFIDEKVAQLRETVGNGLAINALSGGVDSSVVTALGQAATPRLARHFSAGEKARTEAAVRKAVNPAAAEDLDRQPRLDVLLERLPEAQLLAPLDVVADGLHVDARPRDHQLVHDLDGLQLDEPAAA